MSTLTGMASTGRFAGWSSRINEAESSVTFTRFAGGTSAAEQVTVTLNADGTLTPRMGDIQ